MKFQPINMDADDFRKLPQEPGFNPVTPIELEIVQSRHEESLTYESLDEIGVPSGALILIYAGIVFVWFVSAFGAKSIWKLIKTCSTAHTTLQSIPCKNCRYFAKNFYLQCAVRPSDVLTSQAIGCSDYCPQSQSLEK
jgi:hypothetical protein